MSVGGKIRASGVAGSQIPVKTLLPGAKKIRRQGRDPLQRVGDAQAVIFGDAQGVVGQQLHLLYMAQFPDIPAQGFQVLLPIGEAGDHHVPDPERSARRLGSGQKAVGLGRVLAGQAAVAFRVLMLDVK